MDIRTVWTFCFFFVFVGCLYVQNVGSVDSKLNDVDDTKCGPDTVPQYVLIANRNTTDGRRTEVKQVSQLTCSNLCDANTDAEGVVFPCRAFSYDEEEQACVLLEYQAIPRGSSNVTEVTGMMIFEKICLKAPRTCRKFPAFERSLNRVLIGFAQVVVGNISSEDSCINECLNAVDDHGFVCYSAMYYYDSKECFLNYDTKLTKGVGEFFSNETENFRVDYFDNLCAIRERDLGMPFNQCPDKTEPTFVRRKGVSLSINGVASFENITLADCLEKCNNGRNFTCNSVNYGAESARCDLFHVDSRTNLPASYDRTVDHYDRICIEGVRTVCTEEIVAFEIRGEEADTPDADSLTLTVNGIGLEECLRLCLLDPSSVCRTANYAKQNSLCRLYNSSGVESESSGETANSTRSRSGNYYRNLCTGVSPLFLDSGSGEESSGFFSEPDSRKLPTVRMEPLCDYANMRVRMIADHPFKGYLFAKNKFGTCRLDLENSTDVVLALPFPEASSTANPCGIEEIGGNKYSAVVMVTGDNLGIPGLVVEHDQFFNITCDFSDHEANTVTATGRSVGISNPQEIAGLYPDGVVVIPSPMTMRLNRHGSQQSVQTVVLGERINLDFTVYPGFNNTGMGLFVRQCNASRIAGPPPEPKPLRLIDDGCPVASVQRKIVTGIVTETSTGFTMPFNAFRFDGGSAVKITCLIDMCEGGCNPTQCALDGRLKSSHGKRRKRSATSILPVRSETSDVMFTVVDRMADLLKTSPNSNMPNGRGFVSQNRMNANVRQQSVSRGEDVASRHDGYDKILLERGANLDKGFYERYTSHDASGRRQTCFKRQSFLAVFGFLSVMCVFQVVVIATYVAHRLVQKEKKFD